MVNLFFTGDQTTIAEIAGEKIKYDEFSKRLDQNSKQYQQQFGQSLTPQLTAYVQKHNLESISYTDLA